MYTHLVFAEPASTKNPNEVQQNLQPESSETFDNNFSPKRESKSKQVCVLGHVRIAYRASPKHGLYIL